MFFNRRFADNPIRSDYKGWTLSVIAAVCSSIFAVTFHQLGKYTDVMPAVTATLSMALAWSLLLEFLRHAINAIKSPAVFDATSQTNQGLSKDTKPTFQSITLSINPFKWGYLWIGLVGLCSLSGKIGRAHV